MIFVTDKSRRRIGSVAAFVCIAVLASACGSPAKDSGQATTLHAPASVAKAGTLVICSDINYPPQEFMKRGKPVGADIEIGSALAKRLGVEPRFRNTPFDGIIDDLNASKCDAIISAMTDNAERRAEVAFVDYLRTGQSLLVQTANEDGIKGLDDLAGHTVAVQKGTTNEQFLRSQVKSRSWNAAPP
ncbi:MAG: atrA protein, partial [Thermoleophilia bacterium]|nr:atrA protein [Thermoleophilia bacterium]